ncbi:MAG: hypothetical protein KBS57_05920 [Alistipes sp.]|nr:hypothetical protein [Candidatus Minthomonas equi]
MRVFRTLRKLTVLSFLAFFTLCCCTRIQEPEIRDINLNNITLNGLTEADIRVSFTAVNPNRLPLSAEAVSGEVFIKNTPAAEFTLTNAPLTVLSKSSATLEACINVRITDPLSILSAGIDLRKPDLSQLTIDAGISFRIGDTRKFFKLKKYPLRSLLNFGNQI